ncbi:MAG: ATP-dependent Clp protease ATP-binding subunit [Planctomycetes bacterium]|jgi:ATP-dependent Clp protease ATP-binding subunit ClpC|nr:ATP-dependent Clp protease ATP-binding subunit [Planctomycetota bacterium]MCL4731174.1 AAA family ATPase [Planctomycetota bacterium]
MSTTRQAVLLWTDDDGHCNGVLCERPEVAAVGADASEVMAQLKEYLLYLLREEPWDYPDDPMREPRLVKLAVEVRPEYQDKGRRHPVANPARFVVPCVVGEYTGGRRACIAPTFGLWFSFDEESQLPELARHYVAEFLRGSTPARLARFLPPANCELRTLVVTERPPREGKAKRVWPALQAVADPVGEGVAQRTNMRAFERDAEIAELTRRAAKERASVLLVGEPGCGKSTLLFSAAREIERTRARESEAGRTRLFWQTTASRLIAGMQYLGQWEERLEQVIAELADFDGVLCVENLLELVRVGGIGPGDSVGAFLVPYLQHRELRLIAEATPAELDACRRLLPALVDSMQTLPLQTMDGPAAERALARLAHNTGQNLQVTCAGDVPARAVRLFRRFAPYEALPGKAAVMLQRLIQDAATRTKNVTPDDVVSEFTRRTGLPDFLLRDEVTLDRHNLQQRLEARVIGQPRACAAAAGLVTTFKAGLNDPERPVGVLLFAGPTGVGKTELARALADELFGHGTQTRRLIRLDMSEFADVYSAHRLVGTGGDEPGELVQSVREQPFCLVLLDEIEKASPAVLDVLLGMFDEGRLTDRFGRVTNFRSAVIVMTTNLGATQEELMGFGKPREPDYVAAAQRHFRPEFFNRMDAVVTFAPLEHATILRIAEKELTALAGREGLLRAGGRLQWTPAVVELLARAGFDRSLGARPLQRALEQLVVAPLARLLAQEPALAARTIVLDAGPDSGLRVAARDG